MVNVGVAFGMSCGGTRLWIRALFPHVVANVSPAIAFCFVQLPSVAFGMSCGGTRLHLAIAVPA